MHNTPNRLARETSPYLLQHAHNPVDWYPWGAEALERAKSLDRPILLSVGYSACHWCHVMERECFENAEIAQIMNEHFINIKVDREERPDIDHIYMGAVQAMTGQGGWPMTVFLTPDGKPFYGGTYFPPEDRYGRPGFPRVLLAVSEGWRDRKEMANEHGEAMVQQLSEMARMPLPDSDLGADLFTRAYSKLRDNYDSDLGGFGDAPKFPQPMILDFLLDYAVAHKSPGALDMVEFTLEKMAQGGIYDQIGGGFSRYSTDAYWLVPHFEKMTYDNAQLALTYLNAFKVTGDPFYRDIVMETLDYVRREMTSPAGGIYTAQDADSEGVEGKFFVWTDAEVKAILELDDAILFSRYYDVTPRGNWEGKNILNVTAPPSAFARALQMDEAEFTAKLSQMKSQMFRARQERIAPATDEKILVSWNGLMISTLAEAGSTLGRADYLQAARNAAQFLLTYLSVEQNGELRLMRTGKEMAHAPNYPPLESNRFQVAPISGFLEDYAFFGNALVSLYLATSEREWLDTSIRLAESMLKHFVDPNGGFFNTADDAEKLVDRPKDTMDNAIPAGSSVATELLLKLASLTGEIRFKTPAVAYLGKMKEFMALHPSAFGRLLSAAVRSLEPDRHLVVVGELEDTLTQQLADVARLTHKPGLMVLVVPPDHANSLPILDGKNIVGGKPTAYYCVDFSCQLPVHTSDELRTQLA